MSMVCKAFALSRKLETRGFTKSQAEGIAESLAEMIESDEHNLVTKEYLKTELNALKAEIKAEIDSRNFVTRDYLEVKISEVEIKISEVRGEIKDLRTELKGDIATLETNLATLETKLETRIAGSETRMIRWGVCLHLSGIGFLTGLIYFLTKG